MSLTLIGYETQASALDVWLPATVILAQWDASVQLSSEWQTRVAEAQDVSEERRCYVSKPNRILKVNLLALNRNDLSRLRSMMQRSTHAKTMVPLYCDVSKLSADATSSSSALSFNTTFRRFAVGQYAVVVDLDLSNGVALTSFEIVKIATISETGVTTVDALTAGHSANAKVYPLLVCDILLDTASSSILSDDKAIATVSYREAVGSLATPAMTSSQDGGGEANLTSLGYPVYSQGDINTFLLDTVPDWLANTFAFKRAGTTVASGLTTKTAIRGSRAAAINQFNLAFTSREESFRFLAFWDAMRGMGHTFLQPSWTTDYTYVSQTSSTLVVKSVGALLDWEYVRYLGILLRDGTWKITRVTSVSRGGGNDTITVTDDISAGVDSSQVRRVCALYLSRFDISEITENWITDEFMTIIGLSIKECVNETATDLGITELEQTTGDDPWDWSGGIGGEMGSPGTLILTTGGTSTLTPGSLTLVGYSYSAAAISWTSAISDLGTTYATIERTNHDPLYFHAMSGVTTIGNTGTDSSLIPNTEYAYRIGYRDAYRHARSNVVSFTTPDVPGPDEWEPYYSNDFNQANGSYEVSPFPETLSDPMDDARYIVLSDQAHISSTFPNSALFATNVYYVPAYAWRATGVFNLHSFITVLDDPDNTTHSGGFPSFRNYIDILIFFPSNNASYPRYHQLYIEVFSDGVSIDFYNNATNNTPTHSSVIMYGTSPVVGDTVFDIQIRSTNLKLIFGGVTILDHDWDSSELAGLGTFDHWSYIAWGFYAWDSHSPRFLNADLDDLIISRLIDDTIRSTRPPRTGINISKQTVSGIRLYKFVRIGIGSVSPSRCAWVDLTDGSPATYVAGLSPEQVGSNIDCGVSADHTFTIWGSWDQVEDTPPTVSFRTTASNFIDDSVHDNPAFVVYDSATVTLSGWTLTLRALYDLPVFQEVDGSNLAYGVITIEDSHGHIAYIPVGYGVNSIYPDLIR